MTIEIKTPREIEIMRRANSIVSAALNSMAESVKPGVSTGRLEEIATGVIERAGGRPAFLGYQGYPGAICASIDEEVVHGIPSKKRLLEEGCIVSLDVGVILEGFVGDGAVTLPVGEITERKAELIAATRSALAKAVEKAREGNRLSDIGHAVQVEAESRGFSVVREYVGHGIGHKMHEDPQIPNFGDPGKGVRIRAGMVFALEPMVNEGAWETRVLSDGWTVVTRDGRPSAHFEHSVAVTPDGPEILTGGIAC